MKRYVYVLCGLLAAAALLAVYMGWPREQKTVPAAAEGNTLQEETTPIPQAQLLSLTLPGSKQMFQQHPALVKGPGRQALPLVFQGLAQLGPEYQWESQLAAEITGQGLEYTITLKEGLLFSDGTPVEAGHVVESFAIARWEASPYQQALANVENYRVVDSRTLRFTLFQPDRFFPNLLTFPIAKQDGMGQYIGTGPYVYRGQEEDTLTLGQNTYYLGEKSRFTSITLLELPEAAVLPYSLKIGEINCLYDSLSNVESMNISSYNYPVNLSKLVFLGVQCSSGPTAQLPVRQAVDAAVTRELLAQRVYSAKAQPTHGPFPASFYSGSVQTGAELTLAAQYLGSAGYAKDQQGMYCLGGQPLTLTLLFNQDNNYRRQMANTVAQQLHLAGISVELRGKSYEEYREALEKGEYDLYIGEMDLGDNFNVGLLFTPGEGHGYGTPWENPLRESYEAFQQGGMGLEEFWEAYRSQLPAIPLLYRQGMVAFNKDYSLDVKAAKGNIFYNLAQW